MVLRSIVFFELLEKKKSLRAPIGIDIQSKTVEEIAVSIAAQLAFVRRQINNRKGKIK